MVYVASVLEGRFVKIGFADRDVAKRIAALQTGNPFQNSLAITVEGYSAAGAVNPRRVDSRLWPHHWLPATAKFLA